MKFVNDAGAVAKKSYSFWSLVIGLILLVGPEVYFRATGYDYNPFFFGYASLGFLAFGLIGRLIEQPGGALRSWVRIVAVTIVILLLSLVAASAAGSWRGEAAAAPPEVSSESAALDLMMPLLLRLEGVENRAYQDVVGVWTICAGITRNVYPGEFRSDEQCAEDTRSEAVKYLRGWRGYLTPETVAARLPDYRYAAFGLFSYNIGTTAAGKSTATRRLNSGDVVGACEAMTWWNKAGGRVWRGLVKRRRCEADLCLDGSVASCPA